MNTKSYGAAWIRLLRYLQNMMIVNGFWFVFSDVLI